jgi:hypothetical protein
VSKTGYRYPSVASDMLTQAQWAWERGRAPRGGQCAKDCATAPREKINFILAVARAGEGQQVHVVWAFLLTAKQDTVKTGVSLFRCAQHGAFSHWGRMLACANIHNMQNLEYRTIVRRRERLRLKLPDWFRTGSTPDDVCLLTHDPMTGAA